MDEMEQTETVKTPIEILVARAQEGDRAALEAVIAGVRDRIYNLALRMLWHPADAEDATQEILVRLVTHLGSFRGESAFTTWAYRVASNYLLTTRKRRAEREELTFERFAEQLDEGLAPEAPGPAAEVENRLLVEEVKLGCSQGMLLCLDRDHRLAYILGDVFGVTSQEQPRSSASARWHFASGSRGHGRGCTASWSASVAWSTPPIPAAVHDGSIMR
jgi:RNA polymerase sigma factor (sigma-70 family)